MKQTLGMKWTAYAQAYIEGNYYFFWFDFNIPEELYKDMIEYLSINNKLKDYNRYEELEKYAQIAIDYSKVCNYNEEFLYLEKKEKNLDYFQGIIENYNSNIKNKLDKALLNLRIFDPYAQERFIDYCLNLPFKKEEIGKTKAFSYHYHSEDVYEYSEEYEWNINYKNMDDYIVTNVSSEIHMLNTHDTAKIVNAIYPPYDDIISAMESKEVDIRIFE